MSRRPRGPITTAPICTGGTGQVLTAWIPLGDTPVEMGGVIYLEGSDQLGRQMEVDFQRSHAQLTPEQRLRGFYNAISADFAAGNAH